MNIIFLRIAADFLLLVSIFLFPWWATVLAASVFIFVFGLYFEFVAICLLVVIIYFPPNQFWIAVVLSFSVFILLEIFKKRIIFYGNE